MSLYLSGDPDADELLERDAFALVIGLVLDQQVPLERAFAAPRQLRDRLGTLEVSRLASIELPDLVAAFTAKPALHRFPGAMAERVQRLALVLVREYGADARVLWADVDDGQALLRRLRALPGFGEQKSKISVALLAKQLGVRPKGWREVCAPYGDDGTFLSIADIDGPEALLRVREHKRNVKAAARALSHLEADGSLSRAGGS